MSRGGSEREGIRVVTADSCDVSENPEREVASVTAEVKRASESPVGETVDASGNLRESEGMLERSGISE